MLRAGTACGSVTLAGGGEAEGGTRLSPRAAESSHLPQAAGLLARGCTQGLERWAGTAGVRAGSRLHVPVAPHGPATLLFGAQAPELGFHRTQALCRTGKMVSGTSQHLQGG